MKICEVPSTVDATPKKRKKRSRAQLNYCWLFGRVHRGERRNTQHTRGLACGGRERASTVPHAKQVHARTQRDREEERVRGGAAHWAFSFLLGSLLWFEASGVGGCVSACAYEMMHEPHVQARHHHQVKGWEGSPAAAMENGGDGEERARAGGGGSPRCWQGVHCGWVCGSAVEHAEQAVEDVRRTQPDGVGAHRADSAPILPAVLQVSGAGRL